MGEHRFLLRVPLPLWDEISRAAGENRRSINQEILWRLGGLSERGFADEGGKAHLSGDSEGVLHPPLSPPRSESSFRSDFKKGGKQ